jgi:uncharacterized NAD(P)/FAD-binding protein YdhS
MDAVAHEICLKFRVVIIGGGFSGAAVALNLMKAGCEAAITIIEPRAALGAGLAYAATDPTHRVNVQAIRLLVTPDAPGAFDAWARAKGIPQSDPGSLLDDGRFYPQRGCFGAYMQALLAQHAGAFQHMRATATGVSQTRHGFVVTLDTGERLAADIVVLAVSHPPPAIPAPLRGVAGAQKFISDPWAQDAGAIIESEDDVLIIGTALSTADIVATLDAAGHRGKILAISRRGLVSRLRGIVPTDPFGDFSSIPATSAVALLRNVRRTIREAGQKFSCWEAVIEALRAQGGTIWAALPDAEKSRFLRHLRPFWDVHRYQIAPQLAAVLESRAAAGLFSTRAARIIAADQEGDGFAVRLQHKTTTWAQKFGAIVNCTGPDHAHVTAQNPALASLKAAGLLRPDKFGLGIDTDAQARPLRHDGAPVPNLYVAGPLARARFGELMGLPQVSFHAALVAQHVGAGCAVHAR